MAITITSQPNVVEKLYDNNIYEITDTNVLYYIIELYYNGSTSSLVSFNKIPINNIIEFDIQNVLQQIIPVDIDADIITNSGSTTPLNYYNLKIIANYSGDTSSEVLSQNKYIINGVRPVYDEVFNFVDYMFYNITTKKSLLSTYININRQVLSNSKTLSFSYLASPTSNIDEIELRAYNKNGVETNFTFSISGATTDYSIRTINISPHYINERNPLFINENIMYYTIKSVDNVFDTFRVDIINKDNRFNVYNLIFINQEFGLNENIIFNKNIKENIKINRTEYNVFDNFNIKTKLFNTNIEKTYTINSDIICHEEAKLIYEIFYSTAVYHYDDSQLKKLNIIKNNVDVLSRISDKLNIIDLTFSYEYNNNALKY